MKLPRAAYGTLVRGFFDSQCKDANCKIDEKVIAVFHTRTHLPPAIARARRVVFRSLEVPKTCPIFIRSCHPPTSEHARVVVFMPVLSFVDRASQDWSLRPGGAFVWMGKIMTGRCSII